MSAENGGVAAVDRALLILQAWREGDGALPLRELHRRTGLYKSTILRLLASLERNRCVQRRADGQWCLGPMLRQWGRLYERGLDVTALVRPALEQLGSQSGEQVSYWVRDGDMRVRLLRVPSSLAEADHPCGDDRVPLVEGITGRVLTQVDGAVQAEVIDGESVETHRAVVAAPVVGPGGAIQGAVTIAGSPERIGGDLERLRPLVRDTARTLSHALGSGLSG